MMAFSGEFDAEALHRGRSTGRAVVEVGLEVVCIARCGGMHADSIDT